MSDLKEKECEEHLTDGSQSSLRTVLITLRIEKSSAKHIKRVRFNSLVEVRFIPRRRKKERRKNKIDVEEDKEEKLYVEGTRADHTSEQENDKENNVVFKGAVKVSDKWVSTATETSSEIQTGNSRLLCNPVQDSEGNDEEPTNKSSTSATESDAEIAKNGGNHTTDEKSDTPATHPEVVKSRTTVRKSYITSKITLGRDYIGDALRLSPTTFPVSLPIQFSEFPARNARKQKFHDLGPKAVWRLEKQAAKLCQEAEALISKVTVKNTQIQSKQKEQPDVVLPGGNYRQTSLNEFTASESRKVRQMLHPLENVPVSLIQLIGSLDNGRVASDKPVTRFPYIKNKKQQSIMDMNQTSSSELCLPQLLLFDGNGARSLGALAKPDGKRESADQRDGEFDKVKQEDSRNGKVFISYSYGRTKLGL